MLDILSRNFATTSFKAYYFPYAKLFLKQNVTKLSGLLGIFRGF
jgi:hypothetical protein